jgi:hypothetical protein
MSYRLVSRRLRLLVPLVILGVSAAGCSGLTSQSDAEKQADDKAAQALRRIDQYHGEHFDEIAGGQDPGGEDGIMAVSGDPPGNLTVIYRAGGDANHSEFDGPAHVVVCYKFSIQRASSWKTERTRVDCPPGGLLVMPAPPRLANGTPDVLETTLRSLPTPTPAPDEVQATVSQAISGPEVHVEVAQSNDATGVSIDVRRDCVFGRIVNGTVEVWTPPAVTVQPGEGGCHAAVAAGGGDKTSPH